MWPHTLHPSGTWPAPKGMGGLPHVAPHLVPQMHATCEIGGPQRHGLEGGRWCWR